jgi:Protein of unknown function (DUF3352)
VRARDWLLGLAVAAAAVFAGLTLSSASDAPPDRAARFVRSSAVAYLHLSSDLDGEQWMRANRLAEELPTLALVRNDVLRPRLGAVLGELDLDRDVRPWLDEEAALAYVPVGTAQPEQLVLLSTKHEQASRRSLGQAGFHPAARYRGVQLHAAGERRAAIADGFVVLGSDVQVRRALDVHAGASPDLADDDKYRRLRDGLPDERLAHAYLARGTIQTRFAGPAALLAGAARAQSLEAGVVGLSLGDERGRLSFRGLVSSGSECGSDADGGSSLVGQASGEPAAVLGVSDVRCLLSEGIDTPGESRIGRALRDFLASIQRHGISLQRELLPLLAGETQLIVSPGDPAPVVTLIVDGVDERQALATLGKLQPAILSVLRPQRAGRAASFGARRVGDVNALTADLSPGLELSYAAFDGKLVASTSLKGIEAVREGEGPDETDDFQLVLGDRPDEPSAVLFLDFDKLLALADQVGLDANPAYLAVRDDLQKLGVAGGYISRGEEDMNAELLFKNP